MAYGQLSPLETAEAAFLKGSYDAALAKYNEILGNPFAATRDLALSRCRVGVIQSIRNDNANARKNLEESVATNAIPKGVSSLCHYALLQIYVLEGANEQARDIVRRMGEPTFSPVYIARTWALAAEVGRRLQDSKLEVISLQKLLALMEKTKQAAVELRILENKRLTLAEVKTRLGIEGTEPTHAAAGTKPAGHAATTPGSVPHRRKQTLTASSATAPSEFRASATASATPTNSSSGSGQAPSVMPPGAGFSTTPDVGRPPMSGMPDAAPSDALVQQGIELGQRLAQGDTAGALALLNAASTPENQRALMRSVGVGVNPDKLIGRLNTLLRDQPRQMRVGIILPAGTQLTRFKHRVLRAVSAFANSSAVQEMAYSFHIRGVHGDVGAAEDAALSLLMNEHVHAFVGPISALQALGVSDVAALYGVPVLALGPVAHASEFNGNALVRMGVLARSQAHAHIHHLQNELKLRNAAVFAPDDAYGFEMARAFGEAGRDRNFPITKTTYFDVGTDVFQESVVDALGPQDAQGRKDEIRKATQEARKKAQAEKRKFDPSEIKLPAYVNFDALFVPDALAKVKVIASTFAFNDAKTVRYLGDKFWAEGTGKASLADQFLNGSRVPSLTTGSFLVHLKRELGATDGLLDLERQAFDALIFVRQSQYKAAGNNGARMCRAMRAQDWAAEGAGTYSGPVDRYGEPSARMSLFGYKAGKLTPELEPWNFTEETRL